MPRDAGEEVVDGLELQAAVDEVQPGGAVDVHGGAQHLLREGLVDAEVGGAHGKVGERDLHVQRGGDHVAEEDEGEARARARDAAVDDAVAEPGPEEGLAGDLEPAVPPRRASLRALPEKEVRPAEAVEVEATEGEDGVVEVLLVADDEAGKEVVVHDALIVGGTEGGEEAVGDGEEGHVLDVGVVLWGVGYDVVDIMVVLPPAERESTEEVGGDDTDRGVGVEGVRDAHVASIMGSEGELVPEST